LCLSLEALQRDERDSPQAGTQCGLRLMRDVSFTVYGHFNPR